MDDDFDKDALRQCMRDVNAKVKRVEPMVQSAKTALRSAQKAKARKLQKPKKKKKKSKRAAETSDSDDDKPCLTTSASDSDDS